MGAVEVLGSVCSVGLDVVYGLGEVGGQVSLVEDGALVSAWRLSGDCSDE